MKFILVALFSTLIFGQARIDNTKDPLAGSDWVISVYLPNPPTGTERYRVDVAVISDTTTILLDFETQTVVEPLYNTTHLPLQVHMPDWTGSNLCIAMARVIDMNGNVVATLSIPIQSPRVFNSIESNIVTSQTGPVAISASLANNGTTLRVSYTVDNPISEGNRLYFVTVIIHDKTICNVGIPVPAGATEFTGTIDVGLDPSQIGLGYSVMLGTSYGTGITTTGTL